MLFNALAALGHRGIKTTATFGRAGLMLFNAVVGKPEFRKHAPLLVRQLYNVGVLSMLIIIVSGLFIGMVLGLQGYLVLTTYSAETSLGMLVALSLLRELVYNDEAVDAVESEVLPETYRAQLQSWWNITDRDSTLGIVQWLLHEGHHADADATLVLMRGGQPHTGDPEEKAEDVQAIAKFMVENGYCTAGTLPQTVIAWDLVRIANLGRWAFHAGYLSEEEMWQVMQVAADAAREHFASWEEYGRSFAMGRGVWHGDEEDCQTAWEIVSVLLEEETSPWRQIPWNA